MLKLQGLNKAIGDYHRANSGGTYSPRYGYLMLDKSTGEIWTDEFYDLGHNDFAVYKSDDIINLGLIMENNGYEITRDTVKEFCMIRYRIYSKFLKCNYIIQIFDGIESSFLNCENYKDALAKYDYAKNFYANSNKFNEYLIELNKYTNSGHFVQTLFRTAKNK